MHTRCSSGFSFRRLLRRGAMAVLGACLVLLAPGCYLAPVIPPQGLLYANVEAPIDTDANQTPVRMRSGASSSHSVLMMVAWGKASVTRAGENGGLNQLDHVEYQYQNYAGLYQRFTIKVYGQ